MEFLKKIFGAAKPPSTPIGNAAPADATPGFNQPAPLTNSVDMTLVFIPAGRFNMGSPREEVGHMPDEAQHAVTLTRAFWLAATPVTQMQWRAVMGTDPSHFTGQKDLPVENISWEQAVLFCEKLSELEGETYRLPTEAEWEYACRAGTTGRFSGSENLDELGWYNINAAEKTHPVMRKKPNAWGLYDMHGNVWEWCSDNYGVYPKGDSTDPAGPDSGEGKAIRGGAWSAFLARARCAQRGHKDANTQRSDIGFRVCRDGS